MKILINLIIIIILSTILSCAFGPTSFNEMRSEIPHKKYTSFEPANEVAACIVDELSKHEHWDVKMSPKEYGYTIHIILKGGHIDFLADIKDEEKGSSTTYYENSWQTKSYFDKKVIKCQ